MEQKAKQLLLRAIELDPGLASAHFKLGIICQSENDFDAAVTYFMQATTLDPKRSFFSPKACSV